MEGQPRFETNKKAGSVARNPLPWKEFSQLPPVERQQVMETTAQEVLDFFRSHATEYAEVSKLYSVLKGEDMVVRRDSPERILGAIEDNAPMSIEFPKGERYSNAVLWSAKEGTRGLENAYLEGYGQANGVVTVMGVRQSAISDIVELPDATNRFAGLDRSLVRSVQGIINPQDILFVTARIPASAFPKKEMTSAELEKYEEIAEAKKTDERAEPFFIHRGYLFTDHLKKQ